jgi:hypothetical protein
MGQTLWMIEQLGCSLSFGAKIALAGWTLGVAGDLDYTIAFEMDKYLANPVATAAR